VDLVKVIYLESKNPVVKVIGKTNKNGAIYELMEIIFRCTISFFSIKRYVMKYKKISRAVLKPPQAPYLNVCADILFLNGT